MQISSFPCKSIPKAPTAEKPPLITEKGRSGGGSLQKARWRVSSDTRNGTKLSSNRGWCLLTQPYQNNKNPGASWAKPQERWHGFIPFRSPGRGGRGEAGYKKGYGSAWSASFTSHYNSWVSEGHYALQGLPTYAQFNQIKLHIKQIPELGTVLPGSMILRKSDIIGTYQKMPCSFRVR